MRSADYLLPEFRRRLARRRRRLVVERAAMLLVVVAGVVTVARGGNDSPPAPPPAAPSTTTTSVVTPSGYEIGPALDPADVRLPDEGVAVTVKEGVVLVGLDGHVFGHLPGFEIAQYENTPGPLLLHRSYRPYVLVDGRVREESSEALPLAYGAELAHLGPGDPGSDVVRRSGQVLLELGNAMSNEWWVSHDRDIVTVHYSETSLDRVLDLRSNRFHGVAGGCWVADRHGPRLYLVCGDGAYIAAGTEADPPPPRLVERLHDSGEWRKAMASPGGTRLLLQWSGECDVQEVAMASSSTGAVTANLPAAQALGWSLDGRAVVSVQPPTPTCGTAGIAPGVYLVTGDRPVRIYANPTSVGTYGRPAIALWQPALR